MMEEKETVVVNKEEVVESNEVKNEKPQGKGPRGDRKFPRKDGMRPRRPREEEKEFEERVVAINRVSKTVKGGRRMRFSALVVIGDGKGRYGFGTGKAGEVPDAIKKALEQAKRRTYRLYMVKGDTIPHEVFGKYGACSVYLKPAPEGTGIIAGGPVRAILELAGVRNVVSKVYGSRAPINIIRATHEGLSGVKTYGKLKVLRGKEENK